MIRLQKKLTITIDEQVYEGLRRRIGPRKISGFIEHLVRPHVLPEALESAYADMAAREAAGEGDALEWSEGLIGDAADDAR